MIFSIYKILDNKIKEINDITFYENLAEFTNTNNTEQANITIDWDGLKDINKDLIAWIVIPNADINYPIVQASDNNYYLKHNFNNEASDAGTLFTDAAYMAFSGNNTAIYGHNMRSGIMFADLNNYTESAYFNENTTLYLHTPQLSYLGEIFAIVKTSTNSDIYQLSTSNNLDINHSINLILEQATNKKDIEFNEDDQFISLVTCSYENDYYAIYNRYIIYVKLEKIN